MSLRVPADVKLELEQIARRIGTSPATLGADYVTQGVRTAKHPSIEFRQTPAGRMAYVRGVRLPVWLAVETIQDCKDSAERAAKLLRAPVLLLKAAQTYARCFPEEIAADRAAGRRPLEELDTLVPNHSFCECDCQVAAGRPCAGRGCRSSARFKPPGGRTAFPSMGERIDGDIQGQLLAVFGADAFAFVAGVVGAERAAQAVFAHHGD